MWGNKVFFFKAAWIFSYHFKEATEFIFGRNTGPFTGFVCWGGRVGGGYCMCLQIRKTSAIVIAMGWVFASPAFKCWSLIPSVIIIGGGTFGKWLGHEGGGPMNGISALIRTDTTEVSSVSLTLCHLQPGTWTPGATPKGCGVGSTAEEKVPLLWGQRWIQGKPALGEAHQGPSCRVSESKLTWAQARHSPLCHSLPLFFIFCWGTVDKQYCDSFQWTVKGLKPYVSMYPFSPRLPSHPGCPITLNRVPCAVQ